jgi:excisionase family DNA binding protein
MSNESELLAVSEAAEFFRVKVSTIRAGVLYRRIPFLKLGGKLVRFRRRELEEFLENQRAEEER